MGIPSCKDDTRYYQGYGLTSSAYLFPTYDLVNHEFEIQFMDGCVFFVAARIQ